MAKLVRPAWLGRMTLRGKLVLAFVGWSMAVLGVIVVYVIARLDTVAAGLHPSKLMQIEDLPADILWLGAALSLAALGFGVYVTRRILKPLSLLARAVREVKPGMASWPLPPVLAQEKDLWELTQAFDQMARALVERDAQLQHTVRDRGRQIHELAAITAFAEGCAQLRNGTDCYQYLTSQTARVVDAQRCFILLYEKDSNEMIAQTPGYGISDEALKAVRYPVTPAIRAAWNFAEQGSLLCNDPVSDPRLVHEFIKPLGLFNLVVLPFYFQSRVTGLIVVANKPKWFTFEDARLLSIFANHTSLTVANLRFYQEIQQLAIRDGLTGLHNYRYFRSQIERSVQQARRYHYPLSLLLLDIDDFKTYNDSYGHLKGDAILKEIAQLLMIHTRSADLAARYGGEEFVILLPEIGQEQARNAAEKIRQVIEEHPFLPAQADASPRILTVSVGVASSYGPWSADGLIQQADEALYRAKEAGKNRVVSAAA